jgi:hypothetical protein
MGRSPPIICVPQRHSILSSRTRLVLLRPLPAQDIGLTHTVSSMSRSVPQGPARVWSKALFWLSNGSPFGSSQAFTVHQQESAKRPPLTRKGGPGPTPARPRPRGATPP